MADVQIEILDATNGVQGILEVGNVKNFPLSLTTSISDVRDITTRSGSFSHVFKVPSTKNNDDLLEHIYLSSQKNYKEFDAEKDCIIRVNGLDIEKGRLKITKINALGRANATSYSFKFFGNNMDWVLSMKGKKTKDLPYLNKNLVYSDANVQASWSKVGGTEDPVYSFINRGSRADPTTVDVVDLRPDYFVLDYLESAFAMIGYTFDSTHFNTTANKKLIIPFFGDRWKILQSTIDAEYVSASITSSQNNVNVTVPVPASGGIFSINSFLDATVTAVTYGGTGPGYIASAASTTGSFTEIKDDNNNFASGVFTAPQDGFYTAGGVFEYAFIYDANQPENFYRDVTHGVFVNGSFHSWLNNTNTTFLGLSGPSTARSERWRNTRVSNAIFLNAGDTMQLMSRYKNFISSGGRSSATTLANMSHDVQTVIEYKLQPNMNEGDTYNWADKSDDKIDVLDIVLDIFKVFNCYVRTNNSIKKVYVEPRDDFYNALATADNKTDSIDDNTQFTLEYNSKYYKENHLFKYAEDSNDEYLNERNKNTSVDWCAYEHNYPDKFKDGTTVYETNVIAATYTIEDLYMSAGTPPSGATLGAYTARLWNDKTNYPLHSDDFAPRILYFNYAAQQDSTTTYKHYWSYKGSALQIIPFALPFSIQLQYGSYASVGGNLSFQDVFQFSSPTVPDNGLVYEYFSQTIQEIESGKRLNLNMLFDLVDWNNFDFRKLVYFDNRYPEIEGYWRVEKINNYKPTSEAISVNFNLLQAKVFPKQNTVTTQPPRDQSGLRYGEVPSGGGLKNKDKGASSFRTSVTGFDNSATDGGNLVFGNSLRASGNHQTILGQYNVDVSSDMFNLGTGVAGAERSLIRVDEFGRTIFNDEILGDGSVVDISTDTTAELGVQTYLVDTSSGDVTLTLPTPTTPIGKKWNIKKLYQGFKLTIVPAFNDPFPVTIDGLTEVKLKTKKSSLTIQYDGGDFQII